MPLPQERAGTTGASLLTAAEVAERLGMHVDTVHRLRKAGKLPARLHGTRTYRFRLSDVEALNVGPLAAIDGRQWATIFEEFAAWLRSRESA